MGIMKKETKNYLDVPLGYSSFTYRGNDDGYAIKLWNGGNWNTSGKTWGCFAPWQRGFDTSNDVRSFYMSFPMMRKWYRKVIDEFNSRMKNIKVTILKEKKIFVTVKNTSYGATSLQLNDEKVNGTVNYLYYNPLLKLEFSDAYNICAVRSLSYIVIIFFRMFSYTEHFYPYDLQCPEGSIIEYFIKLNNDTIVTDNNLAYRGFTEYYSPTIEDFLSMDIPEVANKAGQMYLDTSCRQSKIIKTIGSLAKGEEKLLEEKNDEDDEYDPDDDNNYDDDDDNYDYDTSYES